MDGKPRAKQTAEGTTTTTYKTDDTPRAFARLLAFQSGGRRIPSGLDDGMVREKKGAKKTKTDAEGKGNTTISGTTGDLNGNGTRKRKRESRTVKSDVITEASDPAVMLDDEHSTARLEDLPTSTMMTTTTTTDDPAKPDTTNNLRIHPHESLRDFSARVDASLPFSNISSQKSNATARAIERSLGLKPRQTKHEKKLQKLISGWRADEERLREKERERADEDEGEDSGNDDDFGGLINGEKGEARKLWEEQKRLAGMRKGKKLKGRQMKKTSGTNKRGAGNGYDKDNDDDVDDDDDDPWKALSAKKLAETRQRNLQDVVEAPPTLLLNGFKEKFKPFRSHDASKALGDEKAAKGLPGKGETREWTRGTGGGGKRRNHGRRDGQGARLTAGGKVKGSGIGSTRHHRRRRVGT